VCGAELRRAGGGRPPVVCAPCRPEYRRRKARQWYADADPDRVRSQPSRTAEGRRAYRATLGDCSVDGCGKQAKQTADGVPYCAMHYYRLYRHGDVGPAGRVNQVRNGIDQNGYVRLWINGRTKFEHRHVVEQALGRPLESWENVHHLNGIKHDNRLENLEVWVTRQIKGQRPEDLARWVVEHYPQLVQQVERGEVPHLLPAPRLTHSERIST
jgi:HNH endonuclease